MGLEILAFVSHSSVNFQLILDCYIPNFKLKYEDAENIKEDCINTVVFKLHQIKRRAFFWSTQYIFQHSKTSYQIFLPNISRVILV